MKKSLIFLTFSTLVFAFSLQFRVQAAPPVGQYYTIWIIFRVLLICLIMGIPSFWGFCLPTLLGVSFLSHSAKFMCKILGSFDLFG